VRALLDVDVLISSVSQNYPHVTVPSVQMYHWYLFSGFLTFAAIADMPFSKKRAKKGQNCVFLG
jgi:hypothetical protein